MIYFLSGLCVALLIALVATLYYLMRCARIILNMTDSIAECLDILDVSYGRIGEILKTPVMMDDPFVRGVIEEIQRSQRAILVVANKLTTDWNAPPAEEDEEEEDEDE